MGAECAMEIGDGVGAVTDITGFGFLGHLREMLTPDALKDGDEPKPGVSAKVFASKVPLLPEVAELAALGESFVPGGTVQNLKNAIDKNVVFADQVTTAQRYLLADAVTSGGLLLSVRPEQVD